MYCDICKKEVNTHIQDLADTFNVKGISLTATIKTRVCDECGAEVWDEQLEKANEKIVYDKYDKKQRRIKEEKKMSMYRNVDTKNLDRKMKKLYKAIKKLEIIDTNSPILINANIIDSEKIHSIGVINGGFNACSEIIGCSVVSNKDVSDNRKFKIIEICTTEKDEQNG